MKNSSGKYDYHEGSPKIFEEKLKVISDASNDAVIILDEDGVISYWNLKAKDLFGFSEDDALGQAFEELILHDCTMTLQPQELKVFLQSINDSFVGQKKEFIASHKDVDKLPLELKVQPVNLMGKNNKLVTIRDCSDKKLIEEILSDIVLGVIGSTSEEVFRSMVTALAKVLSADHVLVGETVAGKKNMVKTIAVYEDGDIIDDVEFDLTGTPFEEGLSAGAFYCLSDCKNEFPEFKLLDKWKSNCFIGTTLYDFSGRGIGVLILFSKKRFGNLNLAESMVQIFSVRASAELERRRVERELSIMNKMLEELSVTDGLTKLYNHKFILEALKKEIYREQRYSHGLSIIMFDIDHFKKINNDFGHQFGDEVLAGIGDILKTYLRRVDIIGRYGGEEFLVILPNTPLDKAKIVAEKIRNCISDIKWSIIDVKVTISGGIKSFKDETAKELVDKVGTLLYKAKSNGRDIVES